MFALSKLSWLVVEPGNALVILVLAGAILLWAKPPRARRIGRAVTLAASLISLAIAVLPVGDDALAPLENRFPPPANLPARIDGIIVLGGAINGMISAARGRVAVTGDAGRLFAALRLLRLHPEARLLYTGGSGLLLQNEPAEAPLAARFFAEMDVAPSRLMLESRSRNTYENAVDSKALVRPAPDQNWVLITSAWHMPRAVGVFRAVGWRVIPYPVGYRTRGDYAPHLDLDFGEGINKLNIAVKEWIGLVAYYAMGRTSAIFPGPARS